MAGRASDTFSIYATARFSKYEGSANAWVWEHDVDGAAYSNTGKVPPGMRYSTIFDANNQPLHDRETTGASQEMVWENEGFDVTSITAYSDTESRRMTDLDGTQLYTIWTDRPETFEVLTQEFRFTSNGDGDLQWMGGLYLETIETSMRSVLNLGAIFLGADEPMVVTVPFETRDEEDSKLAGFGNICI